MSEALQILMHILNIIARILVVAGGFFVVAKSFGGGSTSSRSGENEDDGIFPFDS